MSSLFGEQAVHGHTNILFRVLSSILVSLVVSSSFLVSLVSSLS